MLQQQGKNHQIDQAKQELPDQVDPEQHSDLLQKFGLSPQELLSKLGGDIPGLWSISRRCSVNRSGDSRVLSINNQGDHTVKGIVGVLVVMAIVLVLLKIAVIGGILGAIAPRAARLAVARASVTR